MRNWKTIAGIVVMIATLAVLAGLVAASPGHGETSEGIQWPPEGPVRTGEMTGGTQIVPDLTEEEKAAVMQIMESDARLSGILQKTDWQVKLIGPWTEGGQRVGAGVLIMFDTAVWMQDTFYNPSSGRSYTAELWVGSIDVRVDLRDGSIAGILPNMGKAPITSDDHAAAAELALNHPLAEALGENVEAYLTAVYHTADYPHGIAFFHIRSDQGEAFVAIDLDKMVVVEQYTGVVISSEQ